MLHFRLKAIKQAMGLVGTKVVVMFLTGVVPVILGLIPSKIGIFANSSNPKHQKTTSCLLCFGGGILFGLSLLHMLPEV